MVKRTISIPDEANRKLLLLAKNMDMSVEAWIVFSVIRCLEIWGWMIELWR